MENKDIALKREVAENVKKTFTAAGDKAADMARKIGREPAYYSRHLNTENEKYGNTIFNLWDLADIADAYNVPLTSLVLRKQDGRYRSMADVCTALRTLDDLLGISLTIGTDGRPSIDFQNGIADDFIIQLSYQKDMMAKMSDDMRAKYRENSFETWFQDNLAEYGHMSTEEYGIDALNVGREVCAYMLAYIADYDAFLQSTYMFESVYEKRKHYVARIITEFSDDQLRNLLTWLSDVKRRKDWKTIQDYCKQRLKGSQFENMDPAEVLLFLHDIATDAITNRPYFENMATSDQEELTK